MNAIPARGGGGGADRDVRADAGRGAEPSGAGGGAAGGRGRDLSRRRRAGGGGAGLWDRLALRRWIASSGRATRMSPRPSGRCSGGSGSTTSPARPRSWCWRTPTMILARIAVDLLAQAEHDEAAQSILITDDAGFADAVAAAVLAELPSLPRAAIAGASWAANGAVIVVRDWAEAVRPGRSAGAGAPAADAARSGCDVRAGAPCRRGVPGGVLPGGGGRLCGRAEPRAADWTDGAVCLRAVGVRLPEAHDFRVGDAGGAGLRSGRRRWRWRRPRGCRRMPAVLRCGWADGAALGSWVQADGFRLKVGWGG